VKDRADTAIWGCVICALVTGTSDKSPWFAWVWIGLAFVVIVMERRKP
jgi:hypothetical protein